MWSVWLLFCYCGFHAFCLLRDKDERLMEASWRERLLGKPGFVLMGGAMLGKSVIQFSVWWIGLHSLPVVCPETKLLVEVMKIMWPPKGPGMHCHTQSPCPCSRPPLTHAFSRDSWTLNRKVWVNLLWGNCSILLGPGVHKVLFVPSKSLFSQFV